MTLTSTIVLSGLLIVRYVDHDQSLIPSYILVQFTFHVLTYIHRKMFCAFFSWELRTVHPGHTTCHPHALLGLVYFRFFLISFYVRERESPQCSSFLLIEWIFFFFFLFLSSERKGCRGWCWRWPWCCIHDGIRGFPFIKKVKNEILISEGKSSCIPSSSSHLELYFSSLIPNHCQIVFCDSYRSFPFHVEFSGMSSHQANDHDGWSFNGM